jgi:flavin reductase (DIM6/NTAB) family NADH-FMN oxidoreductase RutF
VSVTVASEADPVRRSRQANRADNFREAMSRLASGVVLVTSTVDGRPWGMTVSSACSICTEPPTMLISLAAHTALSRAIEATGRFGVSVLGQESVDVARFGSAIGTPKFLDDLEHVLGGPADMAAPAIDGALSYLDCEVVRRLDEGDHAIYLGRVRTIQVRPEAPPLVYYRRRYRRLGDNA